MPASHLFPGVPLALASALLFGVSMPLSKLLLGQATPQMLAGLLYLGGGLGLAAVQFGRKAIGLPKVEAPLRRSDLPWLTAVVAFGGVAGPLLLMLGLARTPASSAALLLNLEGLATMSVAWIAFRESVDRRLLAGALAILAGAVILSWQGKGVVLDFGALLIAGACLAWGLDNNLTRTLSSSDPVVIALIKGWAAGAFNVALALLLGAALPSAATIAAAAGVGFLGIGVSLVLFILALRHLGTARAGAYFSLAPFIGALVSVVLLHEPLTARLAMAGALMGFGLWAHLSERHQHLHAHEAIEHEHNHIHREHHRHAHDGPFTEPHSHWHRHEPLRHAHPHYPDIHHRHAHAEAGPALPLPDVLEGGGAIWIALATALFAGAGLSLGLFSPADNAREASAPAQEQPKGSAGTAPTEASRSDAQPPPDQRKEAVESAAPMIAAPLASRDAAGRRVLAHLRGETARGAHATRFYLDLVRFEAGRATPTPPSSLQLREIAQVLAAFPSARAYLGWAGRGGGGRLAAARVEAVWRELIRMGVRPSQRLAAAPKGRRGAADRIPDAPPPKGATMFLEVFGG